MKEIDKIIYEEGCKRRITFCYTEITKKKRVTRIPMEILENI